MARSALDRQTKQSIGRNRVSDEHLVESLRSQVRTVESVLIGLTIVAIAYGDWLVGESQSLGFLYLIPLSYSAVSQRPWASIGLVVVCVALRQAFGPLQDSSTVLFWRDLVLTAIFLSVVAALGRLGRRRRLFFETARLQRDELLREVELAAEVQEQVLNKNQPPQGSPYDIVATIEPARVVGGDYYEFLETVDGRTAVMIADIAGKGLAAAMLMPAADISLHALAQHATDPGSLITQMNDVFHKNTGHANYATVFYAVLDHSAGRLHYANGGHLPGLIVRSDDSIVWLRDGGTPVGLLPGAQYVTADQEFSGTDCLVLYTDGIAEAEDAAEEPFGEQRLAEIVKQQHSLTAKQIEHAIRDAVSRHCGADKAAQDDASLIVVKAAESGSTRPS